MRKTRKMFAAAWAAASLLTTAGCGGGGETQGAAGPDASPEGIYGGTITGASASAFQTLILDDGELWALYGTRGASAFQVRGFIQGDGNWSQGSYSVTEVRDFGVVPPKGGRLTARFDPAAGTISGEITDGQGIASFSGGPIPGSLYRYDTAARLSTVEGAWRLTDLDGQTIVLGVANDGRFSANSSGCAFSGTLTPRPSGRNVFDLSLTFGPAPCQLAGQPAKGIAVVTPLTGGQSQLIVAATDLGRSIGTAAFGTR